MYTPRIAPHDLSQSFSAAPREPLAMNQQYTDEIEITKVMHTIKASSPA